MQSILHEEEIKYKIFHLEEAYKDINENIFYFFSLLEKCFILFFIIIYVCIYKIILIILLLLEDFFSL